MQLHQLGMSSTELYVMYCICTSLHLDDFGGLLKNQFFYLVLLHLVVSFCCFDMHSLNTSDSLIGVFCLNCYFFFVKIFLNFTASVATSRPIHYQHLLCNRKTFWTFGLCFNKSLAKTASVSWSPGFTNTAHTYFASVIDNNVIMET